MRVHNILFAILAIVSGWIGIRNIQLRKTNHELVKSCQDMIVMYEELNCADATFREVNNSYWDIHLFKDSLKKVGDTKLIDSLNQAKRHVYDKSKIIFDSLQKNIGLRKISTN